MLYDGDCSFCKYWIEQLARLTKDKIEFKPYQNVLGAGTWNGFTREDCKRSIKLYDSSTGQAYEAAHAAYKALDYAGVALPFRLYQRLPGFKQLSELVYAVVAWLRPWLSSLGSALPRSVDWFIRCIGFVYLLAFLSLITQVEALFGPRGLSPIPFRQLGIDWVTAPVLFMQVACVLGMVASVLVMLRRFASPALLLNFIIYYCFVQFGSVFMSFQWDGLLLETSFLAGLLHFCSVRGFNLAAKLIYYSLLLLLFKLMFLSGIVKLASGDHAWANLSALNYHYQTQPIPNPLSYFVHQLPAWIDSLSCLVMFMIELVLPWLIFSHWRHIAGWGFIALQLMIIITGNYCFFNSLTIVITLLLFDYNSGRAKVCSVQGFRAFQPATLLLTPLIVILLAALTYTNLIFINRPVAILLKQKPWLDVSANSFLFKPLNFIYRNHLASPYGLFAVMTTERREIIIQGSNDGQKWLDYEFKYKPGDLYRLPALIAPMQPRIDWQMWFAALSPWQQNIWLVNLAMRLLEAEPCITKQLAYNPYSARAPKYIRAVSYRYEYTGLDELLRNGAYWQRSEPRLYLPVLNLRR